MLIRPGKFTPANDPLKRVAMVWRDTALDAIIKTIEADYQSEALVKLRMIAHRLLSDYRGVVVTEEHAMEMNYRIREEVSEWVRDKRAMGLTQLPVEPFLFEVKIKHEDESASFYIEYPEVYKQLEERTAPYDFVSIDRYTLHAMAKKWLDNHPPFINKHVS